MVKFAQGLFVDIGSTKFAQTLSSRLFGTNLLGMVVLLLSRGAFIAQCRVDHQKMIAYIEPSVKLEDQI